MYIKRGIIQDECNIINRSNLGFFCRFSFALHWLIQNMYRWVAQTKSNGATFTLGFWIFMLWKISNFFPVLLTIWNMLFRKMFKVIGSFKVNCVSTRHCSVPATYLHSSLIFSNICTMPDSHGIFYLFSSYCMQTMYT